MKIKESEIQNIKIHDHYVSLISLQLRSGI